MKSKGLRGGRIRFGEPKFILSNAWKLGLFSVGFWFCTYKTAYDDRF